VNVVSYGLKLYDTIEEMGNDMQATSPPTPPPPLPPSLPCPTYAAC